MSRIRDAALVLLGGVPRERVASAAHTAAMAITATSPRNRGDIGPYRNVRRDKPIGNTIAPPGARQQWELYRAREECRNLELTSPILGGYVRFVRIQCLGYQPAALHFDRLTKEQLPRLAEPIRYLRTEWKRYQTMRDVGGTGRSIHQMAGSALHHVDVDGDCFLTARRVMDKRVWDLHPGDALAEGQYRTGAGRNDGNRQLGVETDAWGKPQAYYFRNGGRLAPLNVEHSSFGYQGGDAVRITAKQVQHIRDLSGEITAVRGWPRFTQVIEDIARLDEWYSALVRSATLRAAIAVMLEKDPMLGSAEMLGAGGTMGGLAAQTAAGAETDFSDTRETVRPYQTFEANAGSIVELVPGFKPHAIPQGAPTQQEALAIAMLERRVCAALRTTPATLLGDYKALSFSAGQLGHLQESQAIADRQMMLASQFYAPVYKDWLTEHWLGFMAMFPAVTPLDFDALMYPEFRLRKYQVLDKAKMTKPILDAWEAGLHTYAEARQELGFIGVDVDATIEEWKEDRKKLGLPETPAANGGGMPPGDGADDSDDDDEDESDNGDS